MCTPHVQLHVALLCEAHGAADALVGPLACVFLHVHLQCALLVEGLLAQCALERPLACGGGTVRGLARVHLCEGLSMRYHCSPLARGH